MRLPAEPTCPLIWHDLTKRVRFLYLSPFVYRLAQHPSKKGEAPVTLLPLSRELAGNCDLSADAECFEDVFVLLEDWHVQGTLVGEDTLE